MMLNFSISTEGYARTLKLLYLNELLRFIFFYLSMTLIEYYAFISITKVLFLYLSFLSTFALSPDIFPTTFPEDV